MLQSPPIMPARQPPSIQRVHTIAESRLFRVESVDLRFSNGAEARYERLVSPADAVLIVPVTGAGELLLIREYAVGSERYELAFPKGRVEPGEDGERAAGRELMEEVGRRAERLTRLLTLKVAPGYIRHETEVWLAEGLTEGRLAGDEPEPIEVIAWPLSGIAGLLARDDFREARSIAALLLARDHLAAEQGEQLSIDH